MTYKTHRERLKKQMHLYIMCLLDCIDPDDANKLNAELQRMKNELNEIDDMTDSRLHSQIKTVTHTIESRMKFI